jgi:hypothetical protein
MWSGQLVGQGTLELDFSDEIIQFFYEQIFGMINFLRFIVNTDNSEARCVVSLSENIEGEVNTRCTLMDA